VRQKTRRPRRGKKIPDRGTFVVFLGYWGGPPPRGRQGSPDKEKKKLHQKKKPKKGKHASMPGEKGGIKRDCAEKPGQRKGRGGQNEGPCNGETLSL